MFALQCLHKRLAPHHVHVHIYMLLYARKYNKVLAFTLVILVILVALVALVTSAHLP